MEARTIVPVVVAATVAVLLALGGVVIGRLVDDHGQPRRAATAGERTAERADRIVPGATPVGVDAQQVMGELASSPGSPAGRSRRGKRRGGRSGTRPASAARRQPAPAARRARPARSASVATPARRPPRRRHVAHRRPARGHRPPAVTAPVSQPAVTVPAAAAPPVPAWRPQSRRGRGRYRGHGKQKRGPGKRHGPPPWAHGNSDRGHGKHGG